MRAQLYTEQKKFKARMSYADRLGFPFVILLGEDEIAAGRVSLKNMASGEQVLVTPAEAVDRVRAALAAANAAKVIKE